MISKMGRCGQRMEAGLLQNSRGWAGCSVRFLAPPFRVSRLSCSGKSAGIVTGCRDRPQASQNRHLARGDPAHPRGKQGRPPAPGRNRVIHARPWLWSIEIDGLRVQLGWGKRVASSSARHGQRERLNCQLVSFQRGQQLTRPPARAPASTLVQAQPGFSL
jgi:hypothetical protein